VSKAELVAELRKQGYGRIADMLDAEPLKVREMLDTESVMPMVYEIPPKKKGK
jgi:hypothetical protein